MERHITVRGIDNHDAKHSESIRNYVEDHFVKIEKLLKHVGEPVYIDVVVTVVRPHPDHVVAMHVRAPHFSVNIKKDGPELYKVIDDVIKVTEQELIQHKDKVVDEREHNPKRDL